MKKVAIIGAGLSGLTLADQIAKKCHVTVFEKSNQVSGRLASRSYSKYKFDHGAQFFTAKSKDFSSFALSLMNANIIKQWNARFVEINGHQIIKTRNWDNDFPHYTGIPEMSAIGLYLQNKLIDKNVFFNLNTNVSSIDKLSDKWNIKDSSGNGLGLFDWVVTAIPNEQALNIMPTHFEYKNIMNTIKMLPCFTLMLGYRSELDLNFDAGHVKNSIISWISVNSSKQNSNLPTSLTVMSTNKWAEENFDKTEVLLKSDLVEALTKILDKQVLKHDYIELKRWHYANAKKVELKRDLIDTNQKIASCGDWSVSGRVESAYLSGKLLGEKLVTLL